MNKFSDTLLIIPAYNESKRIDKVINKCGKYFDNILIINDGSSDLTLEESLNSKANFIISLSINCGTGTAIRTGIRYFLDQTEFKYLITIDADDQHSPKDAVDMLIHAGEIGADAVFGSRLINSKSRKNLPMPRLILIFLASTFERIFYGINLTDSHNGLRVLSRRACSKLKNIQSSAMAHATEIILELKKSNIIIHEFPCNVKYGLNNKRSQSFFSSLNIISDLFQRK